MSSIKCQESFNLAPSSKAFNILRHSKAIRESWCSEIRGVKDTADSRCSEAAIVHSSDLREGDGAVEGRKEVPLCYDPQALRGHSLPGVPGGVLVTGAKVTVDQSHSILLSLKASTACSREGWARVVKGGAVRSQLAYLAPDSLHLVARLFQKELESAFSFKKENERRRKKIKKGKMSTTKNFKKNQSSDNISKISKNYHFFSKNLR